MSLIKNITGSIFGSSLLGNLTGEDSGIILPDKIANLELWYNTQTANVIKDGADNISQLTDLSGNLRHATQNGDVGNKYLFVDNVINGNPVSRSDGEPRHYDFDSSFFNSSDFTIFSVQKRNSSGIEIILGGDDPSGDDSVQWEYGSDGTIFRFSSRKGAADSTLSSTGTAYNAVSEPFYILNGTHSSTNGKTVYENGNLIGNDPASTTNNTSYTAVLGKRNSGVPRWFVGDLASLICYSRELSTSEQNQVLSYLSNLYGLTVSEIE